MPTKSRPISVQQAWKWTRQQFQDKNAAHLDEVLVEIGNQAAAHPPVNMAEDDALALRAWQISHPDDRPRLAQLFMRTVGQHEFLP